MCDGAVKNEGLTLCTDNFNVIEVVKLLNVLIVKYNINATLQFNNKLPRIYIGKNEMNKLKLIVSPFMISSMNYKLAGKALKSTISK
jgi:hypothetical protein